MHMTVLNIHVSLTVLELVINLHLFALCIPLYVFHIKIHLKLHHFIDIFVYQGSLFYIYSIQFTYDI